MLLPVRSGPLRCDDRDQQAAIEGVAIGLETAAGGRMLRAVPPATTTPCERLQQNAIR